MTLVRVLNRFSDRELHSAETHRPQFEAPHVENVESDLVALADFAQEIFHRTLCISENLRRRARPPNPTVVLFGIGLADFLPLDNERGELGTIDFRENHIDVRETAVRDEHLLAVENVLLAVVAQLRR